MKKLFILQAYIRYRSKAKSAHGIHSPFVYDFIENVLQDQRHFYTYDDIAQLRKQLLQDTSVISVEDFGAGSHLGSTKNRVIKDIAKTAGRTEKFGKLLFKMVQYYSLNNIVELGTSLGIGTTYIAKANEHATITTIEGSEAVAAKAKQNFESLAIKNVQQVIGNFNTTLSPTLDKMKTIDLLFIDGNHQQRPTIDYFMQALPHIHNESIFIFDDIHWSKGMELAWQEIKNNPSVTLSIDLFFFGIVFFKKEFKVKQHFILKY